MGQFIEQIQKANAMQEQQMTEKKRKQIEKDKKWIIKHELQYIQNSIYEEIDYNFSKDNCTPEGTYRNILNNEDKTLLEYYEYIQDLKINKYKSYKIKDYELAELYTATKKIYRKTLNELYNTYKRNAKRIEQAQLPPDWRIALVEAFKVLYKKHGLEAYFRINEAKPKMLKIAGQENNFKAYEFFDKQNKKLFEEEKKKIKPKGLSIGNILIAICGGIYLGYKADKKKTNRRIKW